MAVRAATNPPNTPNTPDSSFSRCHHLSKLSSSLSYSGYGRLSAARAAQEGLAVRGHLLRSLHDCIPVCPGHVHHLDWPAHDRSRVELGDPLCLDHQLAPARVHRRAAALWPGSQHLRPTQPDSALGGALPAGQWHCRRCFQYGHDDRGSHSAGHWRWGIQHYGRDCRLRPGVSA